MGQKNLLEYTVKFNNKSKPKKKNIRQQNTFDSVNALYEGREITLIAFRTGIFPIRATQGKGCASDLAKPLNILTLKEMLQILPIALSESRHYI